MSDVASLNWPEFLASWGLALLALGALLAMCIVSLPFILIGMRRRIDLLIEQNTILIRHLQEARPNPPLAPQRPAPPPPATRPQPAPQFKPATATAPRHPSPPPILRADVTLRQNRPGQD